MRRRTFLTATGSASLLGLAGCITQTDGGGDATDTTAADTETTEEGTPTATPEPDYSGTLRVATYSSFVDSPSAEAPGTWVKENFEQRYPEATVEFVTPEDGVTEFVRRRAQGGDLGADVYVGLNVDELITADETLDRDLFLNLDRSRLSNADALIPELEIDPEGRAIPYDTGYISLVFDEGEVEQPTTFEDLTTPEYEGTLLAQNAQTSDTGRAFLLWTIAEMGTDGYLDYWERLNDNGVRILGSWDKSYTAYSNEERPMVVSYSTDQVYANRYDQDMSRHQVGFLNGQGYANPEAMAPFATTEQRDLARAFVDFMLSPAAQSTIAFRNVQFPATTHADLPDEFEQYAYTPETPVTFTYDELKGSVDGWVEEWARQIASK